MTTLTDTQVITASGGLVELGYSEITSIATVTSSTLGAGTQVIGPLTVVCDGGPILIEFYTPRVQIKTAAGSSITITLNQNGSELIRTFALVQSSATATTNPLVPIKAVARITPSAGTHTFSISAVTSGGPGSCFVYAGTGTTDNAPAFLRVSKIVQATQWPAVTTGTIICTSSTRPASPFEGQTIYETDTKKKLTYNGTTWYSEGLQFEASTTTATTFGARQDVTGMTTGSSFTAVSGRRYKATYYCSQLAGQAGERANVSLVVGASTVQNVYSSLSQYGVAVCMVGTFTASGVTTVKVTAARDVGTNTPTLYADTTSPMKLIIEDIGPA